MPFDLAYVCFIIDLLFNLGLISHCVIDQLCQFGNAGFECKYVVVQSVIKTIVAQF